MSATDRSETILELRDWTISLKEKEREAFVVEGIALSLQTGRTLGLVGESGCGKTLTALSILGLLPAAARVAAGSALFRGTELRGLSGPAMNRLRGAEIAMVFQEPRSALNPLLSIGEQIGEAIAAHRGLRRGEARAQAVHLLAEMGVADPDHRARAYPHELSGGLLQRAAIAMALALKPALLIADEPTSALDPTLQSQILALIRSHQERFGMAVLLITHDLGLVAMAADAVAVLYEGRVVEHASAEQLFTCPLHPYTAALLRALPSNSAEGSPLEVLPGAVSDPFARSRGCRFAPRCALVQPVCTAEEPGLLPVSLEGVLHRERKSACHFSSDLAGGSK